MGASGDYRTAAELRFYQLIVCPFHLTMASIMSLPITAKQIGGWKLHHRTIAVIHPERNHTGSLVGDGSPWKGKNTATSFGPV